MRKRESGTKEEESENLSNVNIESCEVKRTVLIIEDNETNLNMLTEILAEQYVVCTAENGK